MKSGELDGPVKRVSCGPLIRNPGNVGEEEDLDNRRGRYDCVAVKREVIKDGKVVGLFGHPFVGTADFKRFTYVWCKDNKVPGRARQAARQGAHPGRLHRGRRAPACRRWVSFVNALNKVGFAGSGDRGYSTPRRAGRGS